MRTVSSGTDADNVHCFAYNLKVTRCHHICINVGECFVSNLLVSVINRRSMVVMFIISVSSLISVTPRAKYNVGPEIARLSCLAMRKTES